MKRVVQSLVVFIASSTYIWLLLLTATSVACFMTLRNPDVIKMWLEKSGVYSNIVTEVSKLTNIQQELDTSLVQVSSADIQRAAQQTFTPESIKTDSEAVIDGFYEWFSGEATGPSFNVDFSGRQALFASAITSTLAQKLIELPECEDSGRFAIQTFDPSTAECVPKGVDLEKELTALQADLSTSEELLPQQAFTGDDIKVNSGNGEAQRIASAATWVPGAYKALTWGPLVVIILTVLLAIGLIFLSTSRRKGFRRFAGGLLFTGIVLILSGIFLKPAVDRLNGWSTKSFGSEVTFTQNIVDPLFTQVNETYSRYSLLFGIGYTIPALLTYGVLIITRPKKVEEGEREHAVEHEPQPLIEEQPQPVQSPEPAPEVVSVPDTDQPTSEEQPIDPKPVHAKPQRGGRTYERRPPMIQG